ncbi:MAG: GxxExxY protein [Armatimonadota bacterium]
MDDAALTRLVISAIIRVHQVLGPGFLENIYREALILELVKRGLRVEKEKSITVVYDGEEVGTHRLDILVEGRIIIELKTVEELSRAHYAQLRSYLKATGLELGILVNFAKEKADFRRVEALKSPIPLSPHIPSSPFLHKERSHG